MLEHELGAPLLAAAVTMTVVVAPNWFSGCAVMGTGVAFVFGLANFGALLIALSALARKIGDG